jgi:hypothetical protein
MKRTGGRMSTERQNNGSGTSEDVRPDGIGNPSWETAEATRGSADLRALASQLPIGHLRYHYSTKDRPDCADYSFEGTVLSLLDHVLQLPVYDEEVMPAPEDLLQNYFSLGEWFQEDEDRVLDDACDWFYGRLDKCKHEFTEFTPDEKDFRDWVSKLKFYKYALDARPLHKIFADPDLV